MTVLRGVAEFRAMLMANDLPTDSVVIGMTKPTLQILAMLVEREVGCLTADVKLGLLGYGEMEIMGIKFRTLL